MKALLCFKYPGFKFGSPLYTSKPTAYTFLLSRASIKASSSTISPLATFVTTAPFGKYSKVSLLIKFIVYFDAGQHTDKTSETDNKLFKS